MVRYIVPIFTIIAVVAHFGVQTSSIIAIGPLARLYRVGLEPELRVEQQAGRVVLEAGQFPALGIVFIGGDNNHFLDQTRRNTAAFKVG
jgi:hypothetical protein